MKALLILGPLALAIALPQVFQTEIANGPTLEQPEEVISRGIHRRYNGGAGRREILSQSPKGAIY